MTHNDQPVTLRDWFAGQAMDEMFRLNRDYVKATGKADGVLRQTAVDAYRFADAMIAARGEA